MRFFLPLTAILGPRVIVTALDNANLLPAGKVKLAAVNLSFIIKIKASSFPRCGSA